MTHLPVAHPGKIIAVGLNYLEHVNEGGGAAPTSPVLFAKWPTCLIADGEPIVIPAGIDSVEHASLIDDEGIAALQDRAREDFLLVRTRSRQTAACGQCGGRKRAEDRGPPGNFGIHCSGSFSDLPQVLRATLGNPAGK